MWQRLDLPRPRLAQWAPSQPIRVVIPYAAGGTSDIIARVMSEPLRERLGQSLVIENRGGGATQIGTSMVAKSNPDGHTILLVANTFTINPSLFSKLPYDSLTDLAPITYAGVTPHTIVVNNALPVTNLKELLDLARKRPNELSYGSVGNGTSFHLGTEELKKLSGTSMIHVPYKGMGQVLTDLMAGNIQIAFAQHAECGAAGEGGQAARHRGGASDARSPVARCADRGRAGLSRVSPRTPASSISPPAARRRRSSTGSTPSSSRCSSCRRSAMR